MIFRPQLFLHFFRPLCLPRLHLFFHLPFSSSSFPFPVFELVFRSNWLPNRFNVSCACWLVPCVSGSFDFDSPRSCLHLELDFVLWSTSNKIVWLDRTWACPLPSSAPLTLASYTICFASTIVIWFDPTLNFALTSPIFFLNTGIHFSCPTPALSIVRSKQI